MYASGQLIESWYPLLKATLESEPLQKLRAFLTEEKRRGKLIYPENQEIFNSFATCAFENVKVVIIGQDPYHGPGQAHGLSFSVNKGVKTPPSLVNIFKEQQRDLGVANSKHGNLQNWAEQGVLLLNAVLTVEAGKAASHQGQGWEVLTDKVIELLNSQRQGLVFLLWGSFAHKKAQMIDDQKHLILKAPHPSPLSAHRGFFGCSHFSKANKFLESQGKDSIDWQ